MRYTLEQLQSLSDAEINLIAARAMGYPVLERSIDIHRQISEVGFPYFRNDPLTGPWLYSDSSRLDGALIWKPTTDANQAIELAERVCCPDDDPVFGWESCQLASGEYRIDFENDGDGGYAAWDKSFSRALTICSLCAYEFPVEVEG